MARFTVDTRYVSDTEALEAARPAHRAYVTELVDRGKVLLAGPWSDGLGGFIVYEVSDAAELDQLLADDPYTTRNVAAERTVREWTILFGAWLPES